MVGSKVHVWEVADTACTTTATLWAISDTMQTVTASAQAAIVHVWAIKTACALKGELSPAWK